MRMKIIIFSIIFLISQNLVFCQSDKSSFFIDLMRTEFEAYQKRDPSLWIKYVDDNAVFSSTENIVKTRDQIVEEMKNAPDIFVSASENYDNIFTKTFGNTLILSCLATFSFNSSDGKLNKIKFKFTRVHIKDGAEWKLVYHSAIPI
jgi:ketosteroid isomerase-like protein